MKNNWQVLGFYSCIFLFYPLVWMRLFPGRLIYWSEISLFTPGLIALLCCSLILADIKTFYKFFSFRAGRIICAAFSFLLLVAVIQLAVCYNWRSAYLWSSVYWIAVPFFAAANRRSVEKYLPYFMIILGAATIFQSFRELSMFEPGHGISGNWNWNASLVAVTLPFFIYNGFSQRYRFLYLSAMLLIVGGIFLLFYCGSKAVFLALAIGTLIILSIRYWRKYPPVLWLGGGVLLFSAAVLLLLLKDYAVNALREDQRLFLWEGALGLIKQHWLTGCGPELFESAYAPHIPADYYFGWRISVRHPHSHNHFLQFAATMGIPALIAWGSVILFAVLKNLPAAVGKGKRKLKLYLFVFIVLFIHSMLDIIDLSWPLGCIFLIVLGILIGRAVEGSAFKEIRPGKYIPVMGRVIALCLAGLLLGYLYRNFASSKHYRNARLLLDQENVNSAFAEVKKSLAAKETPQNTYLAAKMAFYDFKNPRLCLKFLDQLEALGFANFENNNLLRAQALATAGSLREALLYFAREQQNFPLSCVNLYYYRSALKDLGRKAQAEALEGHLKSLLKMKGFSESYLPVLLEDPYKDLRFRDFNKGAK